VDLVDEEDGALTVSAEPLGGALKDGADVVDPGGDRRELLEGASRTRGDDSGDGRLSCSGRAVEDHRGRPVALDRQSQRRPLAEHVPLADELVQSPRPHAMSERRRLALSLPSGVGEKVAHLRKYAWASP
jgi:hypothetical protein